jgi:hypothetical protein
MDTWYKYIYYCCNVWQIKLRYTQVAWIRFDHVQTEDLYSP